MGDQGCSKLFQGGVTEVYIPHVASKGVWGHAAGKILLN